MEIEKSSTTILRASAFKFRLPCQSIVDKNKHPNTDKFLEIRERLSAYHPVLKGLLSKQNKQVVIKYGIESNIQKDYDASEKLASYRIPNMIKYYCIFECKERFETIGRKKYVCDLDGDTMVKYIVMPYYSEGDLYTYPWNRATLPILKNILTQACFAVLYAFEQCRFNHNDLHLSNILIRKTKKKELQYGDVTLPLYGYYAIVMDFEKSAFNKADYRDVIRTIHGILTRVTQLERSDMMLSVKIDPLNTWMSENVPITNTTYTVVKSIIDQIGIVYEKSKLPPNPFIS
jgi:serine/threonine protein kinase